MGNFNIYNALAAAAAAHGLGFPLAAIQQGLEAVTGVAGRMEKVSDAADFTVVVDFAHTPDALEQALKTVREFTRGRLLVVFGCGGNRDRTKRPKMGAIAARLADAVVVTSDNPRQEDPQRIIQEVLRGVKKEMAGGRKVELKHDSDRTRAIAWAFQHAKAGDVVLLAGKGHEAYQILRHKTIAYDDREVARRLLASKLRR